MKINEIVVISGKGGTGKTTITASIIPYLDSCVIADCDVDAPDLDILFDKKVLNEEYFSGSKKAIIDYNKCIKCGLCYSNCKFDAINKNIEINKIKCEGCGVCKYICPQQAIVMQKSNTGKIFTSKTNYGIMIHAKLNIGEETSGKLVSEVRKKAKKTAEEKGVDKIIIDGAPGIGCNVISSITGAKNIIIVTEPTISGIHDLKRVFELALKFRGNIHIVINKYDLSQEKTNEIESYCKENNINNLIKIPFNEDFVKAISLKQIPSIYIRDFFAKIKFNEFIEKIILA